MAAPVIDTTINLLVYQRGENIVFQPAATNTPTAWTCVGLPTGVAISGSTGKITGAATESGDFNCTLKASNNGGVDVSAPLFLFIHIQPSTFNVDGFTELNVGIADKRVRNPGIADAGSGELPVIHGKLGDDLMLSVGFEKNSFLQPLAIGELCIAIKEFDSENVLVIGDGSFTTVGAFEDRRFQITAKLDRATLGLVLSSYETRADKNTFVDAIAEIRAGVLYLKPGDSVPSTLEMTSQHFIIRIPRDIAPDIEDEDE